MAKCVDTRPCFAKVRINQLDAYRCLILKEGYSKDGECPFCKQEKKESEDE